jgi:teichuronic acid biosynthesis glycosyltransferase TuaC
MADRRLNVLVLSRNYPNPVLAHQGLWVQRQTHALARLGCDVAVVAPHPYWPPIPGPDEFTRLRQVPHQRREGTVDVFHPRFITGPGYSTYLADGASTYAAVRATVRRLHAARRLDIIHAHFSYPDGVVAVALGRSLGIPVVVTEHVLWKPWMENYPLVRRQAAWAVRHAAACVAVSKAVRDTMNAFIPPGPRIDVIPIGVDGTVFPLKTPRDAGGGDRILFVGWVNYIKGIDVLLDSMSLLVRERPNVHLTIVGGALFRHKMVQQEQLLQKVRDAGLDPYVTFAGPRDADGVAQFMRDSDVLVLPSRRESCGSVLLEALSSGTPVVATRCGGPEEIVTSGVGVLTPVEDPAALADGLRDVLDRRGAYEPARLRDYALANFSWDRLAQSYADLYRSVRA